MNVSISAPPMYVVMSCSYSYIISAVDVNDAVQSVEVMYCKYCKVRCSL